MSKAKRMASESMQILDDMVKEIDASPTNGDGKPGPGKATSFLIDEKSALLKHVATMEQQIEQITTQASNEINQRRQIIQDAKAKIDRIEEVLKGLKE